VKLELVEVGTAVYVTVNKLDYQLILVLFVTVEIGKECGAAYVTVLLFDYKLTQVLFVTVELG